MAHDILLENDQPGPLHHTSYPDYGHPYDAEGLSMVAESPDQPKVSREFENPRDPPVVRNASIQRPATSREAMSEHSGIGRISYSATDNTTAVASPPPVPFSSSHRGSQHRRQKSDAGSAKLRKGDRRTIGPSQTHHTTQTETPQLPRRGGVRNTIKRIFGRRSLKERISLPTAVTVHHHEPEDFISAADHETLLALQRDRTASAPNSAYFRSSGLSSHPPFQPDLTQSIGQEPPLPSTSEPAFSPRRQSRARSLSVPSAVISKDEMQSTADAMAGLGLQTSQEQQSTNIDTNNIGFAITNGSNPRRRSRSVGDFRENDHRMSPIQWRRNRTRSDELRYMRDGPPAKVVAEDEDTAMKSQSPIASTAVEADGALDEPKEDFHFDLGGPEDMQNQERIGLEERLITLEIKLMDLEYALSRLQAGSRLWSRSPTRRLSEAEDDTLQDQEAEIKNPIPPPIPDPPATSLAQSLSRTSSGRKSHEKLLALEAIRAARERPTSIATTVKPGRHSTAPPIPPNNNSFSKAAAALEANSANPPTYPGMRISGSGLTVEHYATLVTLIRHEQSARMRLEEQVSRLQKQLGTASSRGPGSPTTFHSQQGSISRAYPGPSTLSNEVSRSAQPYHSSAMYYSHHANPSSSSTISQAFSAQSQFSRTSGAQSPQGFSHQQQYVQHPAFQSRAAYRGASPPPNFMPMTPPYDDPPSSRHPAMQASPEPDSPIRQTVVYGYPRRTYQGIHPDQAVLSPPDPAEEDLHSSTSASFVTPVDEIAKLGWDESSQEDEDEADDEHVLDPEEEDESREVDVEDTILAPSSQSQNTEMLEPAAPSSDEDDDGGHHHNDKKGKEEWFDRTRSMHGTSNGNAGGITITTAVSGSGESNGSTPTATRDTSNDMRNSNGNGSGKKMGGGGGFTGMVRRGLGVGTGRQATQEGEAF